MNRVLDTYRADQARARAVENAVVAQKRNEAVLKIMDDSADEKQVESHVRVTNTLLQQSLEQSAEHSKLRAEEALAAQARRKADLDGRQDLMAAKVRNALGGI
jgi:hypothetical protein